MVYASFTIRLSPAHSPPYFAFPYLFGQDNFYSIPTQQHEKGGQRDSAEGKIRGLGEEEICMYVENSQDVIRVT